jgi:tRNA dimethylallyltransferase
MFDAGFVDEVKELLERGYTPDLKSMQAIGYRHVVAYIQGRLSQDEALRTLKRDTRRYAKRQLTWFKADSEIVWIEPERITNTYHLIENFLRNHVT